MGNWRFLLDENVDPSVATYLERTDLFAIPVRDAIGTGADDGDIVPYAIERDLIVVTSDVSDFGDASVRRDVDVVLLHDDALPAHRIAAGLVALAETYPGRDAFPGIETLDAWT